MNINDELTVTVEKLTSEGKGIARVENNFVIFVENACPEDVLKIKITFIKKTFACGEIVEIIKPSPHRIEPMCPMQKICGSCQIQFIDYEYQLKLKKQMILDTMKSVLNQELPLNDVIKSPLTKEFRHKVQVPVRQTKNSKRFLIGYFKPKSHEILNIKYCPIQTSIADKIIEFVRNEAQRFNISGYNEEKHFGDLKHIVIRSSTLGEFLVTLVINSDEMSEKYQKFAAVLMQNFKEIVGVCVNFNSKKTNLILTDRTECILGKSFVTEKILDKTFKIATNTFFQVNPKSAENIFKYVKDHVQNNFEKPTVLDAYAGVGAFGIVLSDVAKSVTTIEECVSAVELGKEILTENNISNIEMNSGDAEKFFNTQENQYDVTILDPPRKGCSEKSLEYALKLTKNEIIYVSCNPPTLFRDIKYLQSMGAKVKSIQPFDMFVHSYHVENVAIIDVKDVNF